MTARGLKQNTEAIRDMIDHRLKSLSEATALSPESHLDEDTISAFVEGRLLSSEAKPVLSHLIDCGLCRSASAQLVRLENQITADSESQTAEEEPGRLRELLSNLASLSQSSNEDVVFAYQNPPAEADDDKRGPADVPDEDNPRDHS